MPRWLPEALSEHLWRFWKLFGALNGPCAVLRAFWKSPGLWGASWGCPEWSWELLVGSWNVLGTLERYNGNPVGVPWEPLSFPNRAWSGSCGPYGLALGSQGGPRAALGDPWGSQTGKSGCGSCQDDILGRGEGFQVTNKQVSRGVLPRASWRPLRVAMGFP